MSGSGGWRRTSHPNNLSERLAARRKSDSLINMTENNDNIDGILNRLENRDYSPAMIDFALGRNTAGARSISGAVRVAAQPFKSDPDARARMLAKRAARGL